MENRFVKITQSTDYKEKCPEDYSAYYQVHILSYSKIISTYIKKKGIDFEMYKNEIHSIVKKIKKGSYYSDKVTLYQKDNVFLITDSDEFINDVELTDFDLKKGCYVDIEGIELCDFLGEQPLDTFFKNALTTVGAAQLIEQVEPFLVNLRNQQIENNKMIQGWRDADKVSPKYLVEIYRIDNNYKPVKIKEFKCASHESALSLPEIRILTYSDKRNISIIKDIATGKSIDGSLEEEISHFKYSRNFKSPLIGQPISDKIARI